MDQVDVDEFGGFRPSCEGLHPPYFWQKVVDSACGLNPPFPEAPPSGAPPSGSFSSGSAPQPRALNYDYIELDSMRFRYHPYAGEFSQLVREGQIDRQEWLELENRIIDEIADRTFSRNEIDHVLARLGLRDYYEGFVTEALQENQRILSRG